MRFTVWVGYGSGRKRKSTLDIEVEHNRNWREVASCSIRTNYAHGTCVCEIAFGLDRVAIIACGG